MRIKPRRLVLIWLVISQLLAIGSLIPWLAYAAISTGGTSAWTIIFVSLTFAYPFIVIVCAIQAWLMYRACKFRQSLFITSLFLVGPIFYLVTIYVTTLPKECKVWRIRFLKELKMLTFVSHIALFVPDLQEA